MPNVTPGCRCTPNALLVVRGGALMCPKPRAGYRSAMQRSHYGLLVVGPCLLADPGPPLRHSGTHAGVARTLVSRVEGRRRVSAVQNDAINTT